MSHALLAGLISVTLSCGISTRAPRLELGVATPAHLSTESGRTSFRVHVDDDVALLRLQVEKAENDLDLYARFGKPIVDLATDPEARAEEIGYEEELWIDRDGDAALRSGTWYVEVVAGEATVRRDGRRTDDIAFVIRAEALRASGPESLRAGESRSAQLDEAHAFRAVYALAPVPADAALRLDVVAPSRDVDLWLASEKPALATADAEVVAATSRGLETLITIPARDLQEPQHLFLTVSSPLYPDADSIAFQLFATAGTEAPRALASRPLTWPDSRHADPLQRALRSTVEIHAGDAGGWGSGVLLSASGLILTNDHVVEGPRGEPWEPDQISIALTFDASEPAVEIFHAEVVGRETDADLALLRVVSGVHGNPLPPGKPLPYLREHRDDVPELGETLTVIGYPGTGGDTARPSISLSRGIVSGLVRAHGTLQIKTDAEISFGNSGGPVIDSQSRLLGVATFFVEEQGGRLGYIVPWSAVPQAWKDMLAAQSSSSAIISAAESGLASKQSPHR